MTIQHLKNTIKLISGHEFNTPMHGVLGCSKLLTDDEGKYTVEERKQICDALLESANRLYNLSNRLNTWLMLSEETDASCKNFILSTETVEKMFLEEADRSIRSIDAMFFSSEKSFYIVYGDKINILIALKEIVNNAFKFSSQDHIVSLNISTDQKFLNIALSNHSITSTIAELRTYRAFMQFNRSKYEQQGLGIGIEIAKLALANSGGNLLINGIDGASDSYVEITIQIPLAC